MDYRGVFGGVAFLGMERLRGWRFLGRGSKMGLGGSGFWRGLGFRGDSMANRRGGFSRGKSIIYIIYIYNG